MAAPEQPGPQQRELPSGGSLLDKIRGLAKAAELVHDKLRATRLAMVDETSNPQASKLLEEGILGGTDGGRLRSDGLWIQTLQRSGLPPSRISALINAKEQLGKVMYGETPLDEERT